MLLSNGINIKQIKIANIQISGFYLKLNNKFILHIQQIDISKILAKKQSTNLDDSSFDIQEVSDYVKYVLWGIAYFEELKVKNIILNSDYEASIDYNGKQYALTFPQVKAVFDIQNKDDKILIDIKQLALLHSSIDIAGRLIYAPSDKQLGFGLVLSPQQEKITRFFLQGSTNFKTLHVQTKTSKLKNLDFLHQLIEQNLSEQMIITLNKWFFDSLKYDSIELKNASFNLQLNTRNFYKSLLQNTKLNLIINKPQYSLESSLPNITAEEAKLEIVDSKALLSFKQPLYANNNLEGSNLSFVLEDEIPTLHIALLSNHLIYNQELKQMLHHFGIAIPVDSIQGNITGDILISLGFAPNATNVGTKGSITLENGIVYVADTYVATKQAQAMIAINPLAGEYGININTIHTTYQNMFDIDTQTKINLLDKKLTTNLIVHALRVSTNPEINQQLLSPQDIFKNLDKIDSDTFESAESQDKSKSQENQNQENQQNLENSENLENPQNLNESIEPPTNPITQNFNHIIASSLQSTLKYIHHIHYAQNNATSTDVPLSPTLPQPAQPQPAQPQSIQIENPNAPTKTEAEANLPTFAKPDTSLAPEESTLNLQDDDQDNQNNNKNNDTDNTKDSTQINEPKTPQSNQNINPNQNINQNLQSTQNTKESSGISESTNTQNSAPLDSSSLDSSSQTTNQAQSSQANQELNEPDESNQNLEQTAKKTEQPTINTANKPTHKSALKLDFKKPMSQEQMQKAIIALIQEEENDKFTYDIFKATQEDFPPLQIQVDFSTPTIHINIEQLKTYIDIFSDEIRFNIADFSQFSPYSPLMNFLGLKEGDALIYLQDATNFKFKINILNYPSFILNKKGQVIRNFLFYGDLHNGKLNVKSDDDLIALQFVDNSVWTTFKNIDIDINMLLTSQVPAIENIFNAPGGKTEVFSKEQIQNENAFLRQKRRYERQNGIKPRIVSIDAQNTTGFFKDIILPFDEVNAKIRDGRIVADATYKNGIANIDIIRGNVLFKAGNFSSEFLNKVIKSNIVEGGLFGINGIYRQDVFNGEVTMQNTTFKGFAIIQNVISLIDTIPSLIMFRNPNLGAQGYEVSKGKILISLNTQYVGLESINLVGKTMDVKGDGVIELESGEVDIGLSISTLKSLSGILNKIPIAGYLILGEEGKVTTHVGIKGTISNPKTQVSLAEDLLKTPLKIIERVFSPIDMIVDEMRKGID